MSPAVLAGAFLTAGCVLLADAVRLARRSEDQELVSSESAEPDLYLPYLPAEPGPDESVATTTIPDPAPSGTVSPVEEPDRTRRTLILTHRDFDGLVSGALLLRAFDPAGSLRFTSPRRLAWTVSRLAAESGPRDRLLVADLGLDADGGIQVAAAAAQARARGVEIRWFDHHHWPEGTPDRVRTELDELVLEPEQRTAAALIRDRYLTDDPIAPELMRLLGSPGDEDPAWAGPCRALMAGALASRDDETMADLCRRLAGGVPFRLGWSDRGLIRRSARIERNTQEMASLEHRSETTTRGRKFLVVDARPFRIERTRAGRRLWVLAGPRPGPMVGRQACRLDSAEFALVLWSDWRYSLSRSDSDADFRRLFELQDIAGARVRVAGHSYAAGVTVHPRLRHRLRLLVDWRTPSPVEGLIQALQERL